VPLFKANLHLKAHLLQDQWIRGARHTLQYTKLPLAPVMAVKKKDNIGISKESNVICEPFVGISPSEGV